MIDLSRRFSQEAAVDVARTLKTLAVLLAVAGCGGEAKPVTCSADEECVEGQTCQQGACQAAPVCGSAPCARTERCARGTCLPVACGATSCPQGEVCLYGACVEAACVGMTCDVGLSCKGGDCVDCPGGQEELSCSNGKDDDCDGRADCEDDDCAGRTCAAGRICRVEACAEPTCGDGVQYGEETDVDCGGPCEPCADGRKCRAATDCSSGICRALFCAPAGCADQLLNGEESAVDCGGAKCPGCELGEACKTGADCASAACSAGKCVTPKSCAEVKASNPGAKDGVYTVDVDGTGTGTAQKVHCLNSVLDGGWTLLQRTVWDWNDSVKLHTTFADWYGKNLGAPDPGKAFRVAGKLWATLNPKKEHLLVDTARRSTDGKSCAPLYYKATGGTWTVTTSTARVAGYTQPVKVFNADDLSTEDKGPSTACVTGNSAVPWTYGNCCSTCPTFAGKYFPSAARPMANYLGTADALGKKLADQCGGAAAVLSSGFNGLNAMEYYVR